MVGSAEGGVGGGGMYFQLCNKTRLLAMTWWAWRRNFKPLGLSCAFFVCSDATFNCSVVKTQLRWNLTVFITLTQQKFWCESQRAGCRHVLAPLHPLSFALQTVGVWLLLMCSSLLLHSNLLTESVKILKLSLLMLNLIS